VGSRISISRIAGQALVLIVIIQGAGCRSTHPAVEPQSRHAASTDIVVCGERIVVGVPVIRWFDPGGYSFYEPGPVRSSEGPVGLRYQPGRSWAEPKSGINRQRLAEHIDVLVVHYDACGFSRRCYELLQDEVMLSAHFLLDVDGTVYQTMDLRDEAWHGRFVNPRSIGIEMANIGVFAADESAEDPHKKRRWYVLDSGRLRMQIPTEFGDPRIRTAGPFFASRSEPVDGVIHGTRWRQVDFTPQQYASLAKLTAALRRVFPQIALDAPRTSDGHVRTDQLARTEIDSFKGILGHYHITTERNDPGPAFDWERYLRAVREEELNDRRTPYLIRSLPLSSSPNLVSSSRDAPRSKETGPMASLDCVTCASRLP
jgi:N-acetyl-anhydromuramyl-L-alanine amidase AmpD